MKGDVGRGEWIRTTDLLVPKLAASAIYLSIKQILWHKYGKVYLCQYFRKKLDFKYPKHVCGWAIGRSSLSGGRPEPQESLSTGIAIGHAFRHAAGGELPRLRRDCERRRYQRRHWRDTRQHFGRRP
jgi:hypothetical protein